MTTAFDHEVHGLPMPALVSTANRLPRHVVVGASSRVLRDVRRRGVNLSIWTRGAPHLERAAFDLLARLDFAVDAVVGSGELKPPTVRELLPTGLAAPTSLLKLLCDDVAALAGRYADLTDAKKVRLKLQTVSTDECRLFHVDHVSWRLITTWAGPGTDWLEDDACRRAHIGGRGLPGRPPPDVINAAIVADWRRVHRLDRFAVALCRGITACDAHTSPIVHRSPSIAGTGLRRLRLVVDEVSEHEHHT